MVFLICLVLSLTAHARNSGDPAPASTYLGNEGLMIAHGDTKVLFDPFFAKDFGIYQSVPKAIRKAIFGNEPPFDGIDAIVVSHAHDDHFSAADMIRYLKSNPQTKLIAPDQAIQLVEELADNDSVSNQLIAIKLEVGDKPVLTELTGLQIEGVRIPHAGGQRMAAVSNLVFRVHLNGQATIMHLGDADPDDAHFLPHQAHWKKFSSDIAYPPYWFFVQGDGPNILAERINARQSIGIHVPHRVPEKLRRSGAPYLHTPGERALIPVE